MVALTGDGGDELFGGYRWYQSSRILDAASFVPRGMARMISHLAKGSGIEPVRPLGNAAALLAFSPAERYAVQRQILTPTLKEILYTPEFLSQTGGHALSWLADQYTHTQADDALNKAMIADLSTYMPEDLLVKVDRMSMAHSLECRSPLLDTDLIEWAVGLPSSYKVRVNRFGWPSHKGGKWLLREAVRDRLPAGFLDRPKQGFSVPLEYWFRGGLREIVVDRVLHGPLNDLKVFRPSGMEKVVDAHFSGRANYASVVWALLVLAIWSDRLS